PLSRSDFASPRDGRSRAAADRANLPDRAPPRAGEVDALTSLSIHAVKLDIPLRVNPQDDGVSHSAATTREAVEFLDPGIRLDSPATPFPPGTEDREPFTVCRLRDAPPAGASRMTFIQAM